MLHGNSAMDIDECYLQGKFAENNKLVKNIAPFPMVSGPDQDSKQKTSGPISVYSKFKISG